VTGAKHTAGPLVVRMDGTCSAGWAVIGQECVDPATGEDWFRELGQTPSTHVERSDLGGFPGDVTEKPERFELTADGEEHIANARLWAAAPELHGALIEAAQAAYDAFQEALREVPEGSCVPPWITRLEQAAERAHAALVKADDRFRPLGSAS
jgi:hypothetical protein